MPLPHFPGGPHYFFCYKCNKQTKFPAKKIPIHELRTGLNIISPLEMVCDRCYEQFQRKEKLQKIINK